MFSLSAEYVVYNIVYVHGVDLWNKVKHINILPTLVVYNIQRMNEKILFLLLRFFIIISRLWGS